MGIGINRIKPSCVKAAGATNQSVDFIAFAQQQFCQIRSILTVIPVINAFFII